jgi:hypothetical protein
LPGFFFAFCDILFSNVSHLFVIRDPRSAASNRRSASVGEIRSLIFLGAFMTDEPTASDEELEPISYDFSADESPEFNDLYLAMGKLACHWSQLEYVLNDSIWELANVERFAGSCITSQLIGPGPRIRCLVALLSLRGVSQDLIKEYNSLSSEVEGLGRQRNRFLHDVLVFNQTDRQLYRVEITADRKLRHDFVPIDLKAVGILINQIDAAGDRLDTLFDRVIAETPPWPRKQYARSHGIHRERNRHRDQGSSPSKQGIPPQSSGQ